MTNGESEGPPAPDEDELIEFERIANAPGAGKMERAVFRLIVSRLVREVRRLRLLGELHQERDRELVFDNLELH